MMLVMARINEYIQQLVTSEAIITIAAASKKKDVTQDPVVALPGQRSFDLVVLPLDPECERLENCESLMGLGNMASHNESTSKRILNDSNCI
jgi:hypothetical protein